VRGLWRLVADHRDYRLLLAAGLVSQLGDYLLHVGMVYLVYDLTGSTLASAGVLVVSFLPQALLASAAGVLVDRWDRRHTLGVTLLLQMVALAPLLVVTEADRIWLLYVVLGAQSCLEQLSTPAEQALVPHLVPEDRLVAANALNGQARNIARLLGSGAGGVLAAWGGLPALAVADAATFLGGALLVLAIRPAAARRPLADPDAEPAAPTPWWHEWRAGLRLARDGRALRVLLVFGGVVCIGEGIMGTLFAPFVRDLLDGGARGYGLVVGVQAVGGLTGGLLVAAVGDRFRPARLLAAAAVAFGAIDLAIFLSPLLAHSIWPAVVLMAVVGVPGAAVASSFMTLLQRSTVDAYRGRVFGTLLGLQAAGLLAGSVLGGSLGGLGDTALMLTIAWQGVGFVLMGVLVALTLTREDPLPAAEEPAAAVEAPTGAPGDVPVDLPTTR
jgi:MFS family permease